MQNRQQLMQTPIYAVSSTTTKKKSKQKNCKSPFFIILKKKDICLHPNLYYLLIDMTEGFQLIFRFLFFSFVRFTIRWNGCSIRPHKHCSLQVYLSICSFLIADIIRKKLTTIARKILGNRSKITFSENKMKKKKFFFSSR